jgi:erythromycin esterase
MGFSIFSIEANMPESFRLNDYVLRGQGNPSALIRGMYFWTWSTEEVREMVEWMHRYNADPENRRNGARVRFTGFDVQTPDVAAEIVTRYVERGEANYAPVVRAAAKTARNVKRSSGGSKAGAEAEEAWQSVITHLEHSRQIDQTEEDLLAVDWAIVNARLVEHSMELKSSGSGGGVRDRAMAEMVGWILAQSPKAKIVLWAHNGHVQRQAGSMGRFLEEMFPGQMVVLGFATGSGTYRAVPKATRGQMNHGLALPPVGSFEHAFQATGLPRFVLDLRKAGLGEVESGWLLERRPFRSIGAIEMTEQFYPLKISDSFDAVIWIAKTSATMPLSN